MPDDDDTLLDSSLPAVAPAAGVVAATLPTVGAPVVPAVVAVPAPVAAPAPRSDDSKALKDDYRSRGKRAALRELYGTDDEEEVKRLRAAEKLKLQEHDALVAADAERKRASLTEVEALTADKLRLEGRVAELERELADLKKNDIAQKQDVKIRNVAIQYIRPSRLKFAIQEFRDYVIALSDIDKRRVDERKMAAWFAKFAKDNSDMALEGVAPITPATSTTTPVTPAAGTPPPPERRVVPAGARPTNGLPVPKVLPAVDPLAGKTALPGKPNSMNAAELKVFAKRQGVTLR